MKLNFVSFVSLLWSLSLVNQAQAQGRVEVVWGAVGLGHGKLGQMIEKKLSSRDMDGDGKLENITIATRIGTSQHGNTLKIFSRKGKLIKAFDFSSAGGSAIGQILNNCRQQIVVWDYLQPGDEAHTNPHSYSVFVYDWSGKGSLKEVYYYKTHKKYPYGFMVKEPFLEFQTNKPKWISLSNLRKVQLNQKDFQEIRKKALKYNQRLSRFGKAYRLGHWALIGRSRPGDESAEYELWEKLNSHWEFLGGGGSAFYNDSAEEVFSECGVPPIVWKKLWPPY